jgi:hypothetical protein
MIKVRMPLAGLDADIRLCPRARRPAESRRPPFTNRRRPQNALYAAVPTEMGVTAAIVVAVVGTSFGSIGFDVRLLATIALSIWSVVRAAALLLPLVFPGPARTAVGRSPGEPSRLFVQPTSRSSAWRLSSADLHLSSPNPLSAGPTVSDSSAGLRL